MDEPLRLIRSGVWKAELMLRAVEEAPMDLVDGHRPGCPLCLAELRKQAAAT